MALYKEDEGDGTATVQWKSLKRFPPLTELRTSVSVNL